MASKTNTNLENDIALRRGSSAVYRADKNKKALQTSMKNPETKSALMDFIFGRSSESPVKRNKDGEIVTVAGAETKKELLGVDCSINIETCTKVCKCCGEEKDVSLFYKRAKSKDGLQNHCKECDQKRLHKAKFRETK